jgi:hypothetical protein
MMYEDFSELRVNIENFRMKGAEGHIKHWKAVVSLFG